MNDSRKVILEAEGIEETLEILILEKVQYLKKLRKHVKALYDLILFRELTVTDQIFYELLVHYLYGGEDIELMEKEINRLCFYYTRAITVRNSKKVFKKDWNRVMGDLEMVRIEEIILRYAEVRNIRHLVKCPIHDDKTPSLKIYPDTNSWYCFGCCKGGAPVNLVMEMEGIEFKEAVKHLLNN